MIDAVKKLAGATLSRWRLALELAAVLAIAATFALWQKSSADASRFKGHYSQAVLEVGRQAARADRNAAEAGRYKEALDSMGKLADAQATQRKELNTLRNDVLRMIADAKPEDDGPISPVLADTLTRLRDDAKAHATN